MSPKLAGETSGAVERRHRCWSVKHRGEMLSSMARRWRCFKLLYGREESNSRRTRRTYIPSQRYNVLTFQKPPFIPHPLHTMV